MESINIYLAKMEELISKIEDTMEGARAVPFSSKVSVDKHVIYDIIDDMRPVLDDISKDLPNEVVMSRRIISDSDKIINDARGKAAMIIKNAESERDKMVRDHEITKQASAQAGDIIEDARKESREMRLRSREYVDEILEQSESILRGSLDDFIRGFRDVEAHFTDTIDTIYENRQELRGVNNARQE